MKYLLLISSAMLAMMSTSQAFSPDKNDVTHLSQMQKVSDDHIGVVEAFATVPNLTEFEFNAVDLNNDKKLNRSEMYILNLYKH